MTLNNNSPNSFGDIRSARTYDNNHLRDLKLLTDFDGGLRSQEDLTQNFNYEKTMSAASSQTQTSPEVDQKKKSMTQIL